MTNLAPEFQIGQIVVARIVIQVGSRADDPDDLWIFPEHRIAAVAVHVVNVILVMPVSPLVSGPYRVIGHATSFALVAGTLFYLSADRWPVGWIEFTLHR